MCGVCAGRRGKVQLGDVVAADRLYFHDTGKQTPGRVQHDLTVYPLRDDWKTALEGMDPVARFENEAWFQARPFTTEARLHRALVALRDGAPEPWNHVDPAPGGADEWPLIVAALRERKFLAAPGGTLTRAGRRFADDSLFRHRNALPDLSSTGRLQPFRLHVAPIGSGTHVIEDDAIWTFVSQAMRKTLGIEMEAAAIAELAHRQRQHAGPARARARRDPRSRGPLPRARGPQPRRLRARPREELEQPERRLERARPTRSGAIRRPRDGRAPGALWNRRRSLIVSSRPKRTPQRTVVALDGLIRPGWIRYCDFSGG